MPRALLIVLDSVGIGGAPDAVEFGDPGADTLGHIASACASGFGNRPGLRDGQLQLPNLAALGIGLACEAATGRIPPGLPAPPGGSLAAWGAARAVSRGKDTVSGHWEIAGAPVLADWGYFPDTVPAFPPSLVSGLVQEAQLPGILGDQHASGVAIIEELGAEHIRTGRPICYTSVDSVLQIAAHEESFGLERLYGVCAAARRLCDPLRIGRVIARPFLGSPETGFVRTARRRDYAMPPQSNTILDILLRGGRAVVTVGKVGDIFAHRGTGRERKAVGNAACLDAAMSELAGLPDGGLVFANLVDFDTEFGHRRDVPGYAAALEAFDRRVPAISATLRPGDLCIVTADHGNDPTFRGTDHTRERIPVLCFGPEVRPGPLGPGLTFADIGATVAAHLGAPLPGAGTPLDLGVPPVPTRGAAAR